MAVVVTSFTPSTGPTTGGTAVTITGTGLTTASSVMFGDVEGRIDTTQVNTGTTLHVIAPPIPNTGTLVVKITVLDSTTPSESQSSGSYTYTTVAAPVLVSVPASKWKCDIDTSVAQDGSSYIPIKAMADFQPQLTTTMVDDSDYDSGSFGSDAVTQRKWAAVMKLARKRSAGYVEDPGQAALRAASDQVGTASVVRVRFYDRNGNGSEAYYGFAAVEWSEDGGAPAALSTVSVTLHGQGARVPITNPIS